MGEKIVGFILLWIVAFGIGFGTGYFITKQPYDEYRERTEAELGQLRGALGTAQVRSDTAIRGLDEAIRGVSAIQDRNRRIAYLIESIRATVSQLRAIYDTTSSALQTNGTTKEPVEDSSNN